MSPRDPLTDADAFEAQLDHWERQSREQVARSRRVSAAVQAVRVTRSSPGREVTVTVDHAGLLVDLQVSERTLLLDPRVVGRLITATNRSALGALGDAVAEALADVVDEDDPLARSAVSHYRSQFGSEPGRLR